MNRILSCLILIAFLSITETTFGLTVYNTRTDITSQVGGIRYYASNQTPGTISSNSTRIQYVQGVPGSKIYRPGQTSSAGPYTINETPMGYGWATNFPLGGDIPAGQWSFRIMTRNNVNENSPGYIGVNVFKYCNGTNTRLFYVQGTTDVTGSTSMIDQNITTSQPDLVVHDCRLKFEYWLTVTNIAEDNTNTIYNVNTNIFSITFPDPAGSTCQDADGDGFHATSCGGDDCNDNNASIKPAATEVCNNVDDNCNGQTDENLQMQTSCGVGACLRTITQTCTAGSYSPACTPGNPTTETCNGVDDNCNGQIDDSCQSNQTTNGTCTSGTIRSCGLNIGACAGGQETCLTNGTWGQCSAKSPAAETCNNIDDDCDGLVDEELFVSCGLSVGVCRQGISQCNGGSWGACENEIKPSAEACDYRDNDCDGLTDENGVCITNATGPCRENWFCSGWSSCTGGSYGTRNCTDRAGCGTIYFRPALSRLCISPNTTVDVRQTDDTGSLYTAIFTFMALVVAASLLIVKIAG